MRRGLLAVVRLGWLEDLGACMRSGENRLVWRYVFAVALGLLVIGCSSTGDEALGTNDVGREAVSGPDSSDAERSLGEPSVDGSNDVVVSEANPADGVVPEEGSEGSGEPDGADVEEADTTTTVVEETSGTTAAPTATTAEPEDPCQLNPQDCAVVGEDFSNRDLNSAVFFEADLTSATFENTNLADSDFSSAVAVDANFTGATLTDVIIENADFTGVNFSNANLQDAFIFETTLDGAIWDNTTCPDGSNSDDNGGTCLGAL